MLQHTPKFFNPKKLSKKDKKRYFSFPSLKNSLDFKVSRTLLGMQNQKRHFCISHKNGYAIVGINSQKIGIDFEEIKERENLKELLTLFSVQEEINFFNRLDKHKQLLFFYELFTLKEALIKLENSNFTKIKSHLIMDCQFISLIPKFKNYSPSLKIFEYSPLWIQPQGKKLYFANFFKASDGTKQYLICICQKAYQRFNDV